MIQLDDSTYPSMRALSDAFTKGALRATAITQAHLDRIERLDPDLGAFQTVDAADAMRQAEAADRMFAAGANLGPFHGIPFGLKDICDVEGRVTTAGSKALQDRVSSKTARWRGVCSAPVAFCWARPKPSNAPLVAGARTRKWGRHATPGI